VEGCGGQPLRTAAPENNKPGINQKKLTPRMLIVAQWVAEHADFNMDQRPARKLCSA
jgi:hypothetical protein